MVPQILRQDHSWERSKARVSTSVCLHAVWVVVSSPHKLGFECQRVIPSMEETASHACVCFRIFHISHFKFVKVSKHLISRLLFSFYHKTS